MKGLQEAKRANLKYITATYPSEQLLLSLVIYLLGWSRPAKNELTLNSKIRSTANQEGLPAKSKMN